MSVTRFSASPPVDTDTQEIDWYLPSGEKISPNRPDISITLSDRISTLIIYNADLDKAGVYRCVARSGDSEAQGTINVTIFRKPRPAVSVRSGSLTTWA